MKTNKIALAAMILLTSSLPAQSASSSVNFSGTVSSSCSFTTVTNGVLIVPGTEYSKITSVAASGGTPGSVTIAYNGTPNVSVAEMLSFTSSPSLANINPTYETRVFNASGNLTYNNGFYEKAYTSGTSDVITINLTADTGNTSVPWPVGNYTATTTVTCQ